MHRAYIAAGRGLPGMHRGGTNHQLLTTYCWFALQLHCPRLLVLVKLHSRPTLLEPTSGRLEYAPVSVRWNYCDSSCQAYIGLLLVWGLVTAEVSGGRSDSSDGVLRALLFIAEQLVLLVRQPSITLMADNPF
jgi:hypothetical protein